MIARIDLDTINWAVHGVDTFWLVHDIIRGDREEACDLRDDARVPRRAAARSAANCADCLRALAPNDAATMTTRNVGSRLAPRWLYVPICRRCASQHDRERARRGAPALYRAPTWSQCRCLNCRRPIRVPCDACLAARTCCADCERRARYDRNNRRRRRRLNRRLCPSCRTSFVPTRDDALTCSNRCRQALHRRRRRNG